MEARKPVSVLPVTASLQTTGSNLNLSKVPTLSSRLEIHGVFDGRSHKLIPWIDDVAQDNGVPIRYEHWSSRSMTIENVATFLGQIRAVKKGSAR